MSFYFTRFWICSLTIPPLVARLRVEESFTRQLQLIAFALLALFIVPYADWKMTKRSDQVTKMPRRFDQITPMAQHPIVEELREREATDPKDLFYGIVGILGDDTLKGLGSRSIDILYRKLCTSLIERTGSLDILLLADPQNSKLEAQPSWVIDWRSKEPQVLGKAIYYHEMTGIRRYLARLSLCNTLVRILGTLSKCDNVGHH